MDLILQFLFTLLPAASFLSKTCIKKIFLSAARKAHFYQFCRQQNRSRRICIANSVVSAANEEHRRKRGEFLQNSTFRIFQHNQRSALKNSTSGLNARSFIIPFVTFTPAASSIRSPPESSRYRKFTSFDIPSKLNVKTPS